MVKTQQLRSFALYLLAGLAALWLGGLVRAWPMAPVDSQVVDRVWVQYDGGARRLLNGEPQLLYLFAPWCAICGVTIDGVGELPSNTVLVAQSYDNRAELDAFIADHPGAAKALLGEPGFARQLSVPAYPAYVLLDEEGRVLARRVGYLPNWLLRVYLWWYGVLPSLY